MSGGGRGHTHTRAWRQTGAQAELQLPIIEQRWPRLTERWSAAGSLDALDSSLQQLLVASDVRAPLVDLVDAMQTASGTAVALLRTEVAGVDAIVRMGKLAEQLVTVTQAELALLQRCAQQLEGLYR